jgi:phage gpG-like protein
MSGKYARDDTTSWQKPDWTTKKPIKSTQTGEKVQHGENLAGDITKAAEHAEEKGIGWQKPAWATQGPQLKSTAKGEKLKQGNTDLARPITFPKGKN